MFVPIIAEYYSAFKLKASQAFNARPFKFAFETTYKNVLLFINI